MPGRNANLKLHEFLQSIVGPVVRYCPTCHDPLPCRRYRCTKARGAVDVKAERARKRRAKREAIAGTRLPGADAIDAFPHRCMVRFFADKPCRRPARWYHNGCRYCDEHRPAAAQPLAQRKDKG